MKARHHLSLALLAVVATAAPVAAQARLPVAFVSMQRITTEAVDAKNAAVKIETLRQTKAQELNAMKQELDALKLEFANSQGFFRASRRQTLQAEIARKEPAFQQATVQAQHDMQELQQTLQASLRKELSDIVTEIAKARGYQFVFNQDSALVLGPSGADLTQEVLDRLNALAAQRAQATPAAASAPGAAPPQAAPAARK